MFSSNFRRFLWPQLLLIALVALVVALVAGFALDDANARVGSVVWTAALAAIVACLIAGAITWWNSLRQTKKPASFSTPSPRGARRPALASIDDDEVLHDIARTFAELMNEATKDQARSHRHLLDERWADRDRSPAAHVDKRRRPRADGLRCPKRGKQLWEILPSSRCSRP